MKTKLMLFSAALLLAASTLFSYEEAYAQPATCWFSYDDGCTRSGNIPCTDCDDDGPIITPPNPS